jgi:hypothetical protein
VEPSSPAALEADEEEEEEKGREEHDEAAHRHARTTVVDLRCQATEATALVDLPSPRSSAT